MLSSNNKFIKLNGSANVPSLRANLNRRIDLLDFPKFGGIRGLGTFQDTESLTFPWFSDIRYVWNTPVLYSYPSIRNDVLNSIKVQSTISTLVEAGQGTYASMSLNAKRFYEGIRASISKVWCRFLGYLMFKIFRRLMNRLLVIPSQLEALKKAHDTDIPIVYLPLHRSHMDYQIITWCIWHFNLRIQYVAAGDNLNLSGFGWFLRATGAFFIRRNLGPNAQSTRDVLYRAVLNSYLIGLLKSGQSIEFFLEGTRSRMGKTLLPKNGLISNIVEAVENGELRDCYLVPVSVNYDGIVEGIFYDELMGIRKPNENLVSVFWGIIESFRRKQPCGNVSIDFGTPTLLSNELKAIKEAATKRGFDYATNTHSYRELLPWDDRSLMHKTLIRATGYHLVYNAQRQKPIGLTSLVSILFLCKYRRRSVRVLEVTADLSNLIEEVQRLNYEVIGWFVDKAAPQDIVLASVKYLENALEVSKNDGGVEIRINDCQKSWITLAYHKNNGLSPFTLISIAAIVSDMKSTNGNSSDPIRQMQTLCSFLRYEILLFSPLDSLDVLSQESLEFFTEKRNTFDSGFYALMVLPFVEALYYVAACIFENPTKFNTISDASFIRQIVTQMAEDSSLEHKEAANSDSVYYSLKALRGWGAVNDVKVEPVSKYLLNQVLLQLRLFSQRTVA